MLLLSFSALPASALVNPVLAGYSLNGIEKASNAFFAYENKTPSSVFLLLKTSKNSSELSVSLEETASNDTPSNDSLCSKVFSVNSSSAGWLEVQLEECPRLKQKTVYHIVLSAAAANASNASPLDYATVYYAFNKNSNDSFFSTKPFPSAGWKRLNNSVPLFALKYSDGSFWRHGGGRVGGGAGVLQIISDCSTLSSANTYYTLTANISSSAWNICMNVTAQNVTLDCQGNYIDGLFTLSTYGVFVNNTVDFTLRNCVLSDWGTGIYVNASNNTNVGYSNLTANNGWQMEFYNTFNTTIQNNNIAGFAAPSSNGALGKWGVLFQTVAGGYADNDLIHIFNNTFRQQTGRFHGRGIYVDCNAGYATCSAHPHELRIEQNNFFDIDGSSNALIWLQANYTNTTIQYNWFNNTLGGEVVLEVSPQDYGYVGELTFYNNSMVIGSGGSVTGILVYSAIATNWNVSNNAIYNNWGPFFQILDYVVGGVDRQVFNSVFYNNSIQGTGYSGLMSNTIIDCAGQQVNGSLSPGSPSQGIHLNDVSSTGYYANNDTVRNCNVFDSGSNNAIYVQGDNASVLNNLVTNAGTGIYLSPGGTGTNNLVFNNSVKNIYIPGGRGMGVFLYAVTNSNVSYNYIENVTADDFAVTGGSLCLYSYQSSYNKIHNNNITDCPFYTVLDSTSTANEYYNNFVNNSNFSFMFTGGAGTPDNNATMHNNVINGTTNVSISLLNYAVNITSFEDVIQNDAATIVADVYLGNSINYGGLDQNQLILINTTFNKSLVTVRPDDTNSNVTVKWYTDVHVVDDSSNDVASANLNISNTLNTSLQYEYFNLTTNSTGWISWQNVTEYWQNETGISNFTPHNIAASKQGYLFAGGYGYFSNVTQNNYITSQSIFTIVLGVIPLNLSYASPTLANGNFSGDSGNNWIYVNVSYQTSAGIDTVVLDWNGTNETNTMDCTSGYNCWINKTGLVWGNYSFSVFLNTTSRAGNQTETRWNYLDICGTLTASRTLYVNVTTSGSTCMTFGASSIGLDCAGHSITGDSAGGTYGVLSPAADSVSVYNCTITGFEDGIRVEGAASNSIYSNTVSNNSNANVRLACKSIFIGCNDATYASVVNNTLENSQYGIHVSSSGLNINTFHSISNNSIKNASVASVYFDGASNNVVFDSMLSANYSNGGNDSSSTGSSNNTFVNVTFNKTAAAFGDANSNLAVKWYADAHVVNNLGADVASANVNISNTLNTALQYEYFNVTANSTGWTSKQNVTEYFQNSSGVANFTPHRFAASNNGYATNTTEFSVTGSSSYTLVLGTPLSACGFLTASGYYQLTQNVSSDGSCFNISANNIILDCNGFNINYSSTTTGYAVNDSGGYTNLTVMNCVINYTSAGSVANSYAIYLNKANYSIVRNNSIRTIGTYNVDRNNFGVYLTSTYFANITNNTVNTQNRTNYYGRQGTGVYLTSSHNNTIANNKLMSIYTVGTIYLLNSANNTVESNNVTVFPGAVCCGTAILISSASSAYNLIKNNNVTADLMYGIQLTTAGVLNNLTGNNVNTSYYTNSYFIQGSAKTYFNQTIDTTNLAEGLPVVYNWSLSNQIVFRDAILNTTYGELMCGWCSNVTYQNLTVGSDGINLFSTNLSTVTNNTFITNMGSPVFIYSSSSAYGSYNNVSLNKIIINSGIGSAFYAISYSAGGAGLQGGNISYNNITSSETTTAGLISVGYYSNGSIAYNNVSAIQTGNYGLYVANSNNNTIAYNNLRQSSYGIYLTASLYNNLMNNTLYLTSVGSGFYFTGANWTNAFDNTIKGAAGASTMGIYLYLSSNNTFRNQVVQTSPSNNQYAAILAYISTNNSFANSSIWSNRTYAYRVYSTRSSNTTFQDSTLNSTWGADVQYDLTVGGETNLTNCTFNKSDLNFSSTSTGIVRVMWYVDVHVINNTNGDVASANVNISNTLNTSLQYEFFNLTTNATGWVARQNVTEYWKNVTATYNFTPHNITASREAYVTNATENNNVTQSTTFTIVLSAGALAGCGYLGTPNTYYTVVQNLSSPGATCFTIVADNITLDCEQHSVTGDLTSNTYGVLVNITNNTLVKNCVIKKFDIGVNVSGSFNTTITANNVSYNSRGIRVLQSYNGTISDNVRILGMSSRGIDLFDNVDYFIVRNNSVESWGAEGIFVGGSTAPYYSEYNSIYNNTVSLNVTVLGQGGLDCGYRSQYNTLYSNVINATNNAYGIVNENANTFNSNMITTVNGFGIINGWTSAGWSNYSNNQITSGNTSLKITNNVGNCLFYNNTFVSTASNATELMGASTLQNVFVSNTFTGNAYGIYFNKAPSNNFTDSTISGVTGDLFLNGSSYDNLFINTTFNKNAVYWGDSGSNITVKWYVDVHAINSSASGDVASASIQILDVNGSSVYSGSTNATGWITRQNVTEYFQNSSGIVNYTPHSFKGSKTGFLNNQTTAQITSSTVVMLFLPDDWHVIYGNVTLNQTIANTAGSSMDLWNATQGNVYAACQDSSVNWSALQALGMNASGGKSTDSFNRADSALNLTGSNDSIRKRFASNTGITADNLATFIVRGRTIEYVPIANSTNSSNFVTGILWDTSDGGTEYSNVTKQDLVFVTALNANNQGEQGVYAFELLFPLTLANYTGTSHNASITVEAR